MLSLLIIGCGTARETPRDTREDPQNQEDTRDMDQNRVDEQMLSILNDNRSKPGDVYYGLENEIPSVFRQQSAARDIGDPNQGYRIQIYSTRNVQEADDVAEEFRSWASTRFTDYIPKAYVLFRQPYYKVHIGNFQFHDRAQALTRIIKSRFPDAWVVHDEVEPELVPSESLEFQ